MSKLIGLLFFIIVLIIGYAIGNYLPNEILHPDFTDNTYSRGEYYKLVVSIISAFMTFAALIIALFKEDIREIWNRPRISFSLPEKHILEETDTSLDSESGTETIKANRYLTRIEINNTGNLPALDCEMYLESLVFIPKETSILQQIECSAEPLEWNRGDTSKIIIPPGGKKRFDIIEIKAPEKISTPDSVRMNNKTQLIIGTIPNRKDHPKGKWKAKFSFYAQNHSPVSFEVQVEWNGVWKNRLTEFTEQFQVSKVQK